MTVFEQLKSYKEVHFLDEASLLVLTALGKAVDAADKGKPYSKHLIAAATVLASFGGDVEKAAKKVERADSLDEAIAETVRHLGKAAVTNAKYYTKHLTQAAAILAVAAN